MLPGSHERIETAEFDSDDQPIYRRPPGCVGQTIDELIYPGNRFIEPTKKVHPTIALRAPALDVAQQALFDRLVFGISRSRRLTSTARRRNRFK
jgi:hypothetical protein